MRQIVLTYRIRIVLLDYDLTLVSNILDFYDAYNEALKNFLGKTVSFNKFYDLLINYRLDYFLGKDIDKEAFWRFFRKNYRSMYGYPVDGAYYFLYWVKNMNMKSVIISGRECHPDVLYYELRRFGLDEYIDEIYTLFNLYVVGGVEEELFDKTWLIRYVLKKHGIDPSEAVYIGDYRLDYISSKKAGVEFIGVAFDPERKECLYRVGAKYVGENLYDALYYLLEIIRDNKNRKKKGRYLETNYK
ncbi:MAG: HAD hydrolase-like protein [Staphylothermus sp.]|nr:HAD hydrolase-like protein [Staphylothermus sp.]